MNLFADTSFYYASLDPRDPDHAEASSLSEWIQNRSVQLISTWEIILETVTLLRYRYSHQSAVVFIHEILPSIQIFYLSDKDRQAAFKSFEKLAADKRLSLCDIISHHVVTKYLYHAPCLTFDDDFESLGLTLFRIPN